MMDMTQVSTAKSDQLNADDLIGRDLTGMITSVDIKPNQDQPVSIRLSSFPQPYKPCKSMIRALIFAWGKDGEKWIGRTIKLYREESVTWAGKSVGGIRVKAVSHIKKSMTVMLTVTRGKKSAYKIDMLPFYDQSKFDENYGKWQEAVESGKLKPASLINKIESTGVVLTDEQRTKLLEMS